MAAKKILIIGAGWEQAPLVKKAKEMALYVIATNPTARAAGFRYADKKIIIDPRHLAGLRNIVKKFKVDAIVSDNCDYSLFATAFLGSLFNLPATSMEAAQLTTNKFNCRERCSQFNLPQPKYFLCKDLNEAGSAIKKLGLPAILKPVDNRGSFGVKIIFNKKNLKKYFLEALANSHSREVLAEQYIEGINLTIDGYAFQDGHLNLGIASKTTLITREDKPITKEVIYPAQITARFIRKALANNEKIIKALNIKYGATHAEYMITKEGVPFLLEIANRGGGVMTSESIIPAITGVNIPELLIKNALGVKYKKPRFNIGKNKSAILHFFVLQQPGEIKRILRLNKIKKRKDILHFMLFIKKGDKIGTVKSGADRHGFFIVAGKTRETAREKSKSILNDLKLVLVRKKKFR